MSIVEGAVLFWQIVEATLVELYGFDPTDAQTKIAKLHGKLTPRAINRDLTYHWQPLDVAADIANFFDPIPDQQLAAYHKIVQRLLERFVVRAAADTAGSSRKATASVLNEAETPIFATR